MRNIPRKQKVGFPRKDSAKPTKLRGEFLESKMGILRKHMDTFLDSHRVSLSNTALQPSTFNSYF